MVVESIVDEVVGEDESVVGEDESIVIAELSSLLLSLPDDDDDDVGEEDELGSIQIQGEEKITERGMTE